MAVPLYMDVHVPQAITDQLRRRGSGGTFEGVAFDEDHRCVMICVRQGPDWRIVMEQSSQNDD